MSLRTLFLATLTLLIGSVSPAFAGWVANYGGGDSASPKQMAVGADGSIYIAGTRTVSGKSDVLLLKYDTSGILIWVKTYGNSTGGDDAPAGIAIRNDGTNDYIHLAVDSTYGGTRDHDVTTLKYKDDGSLQWVKTFDGGSTDTAEDIKVDSSGNVYVLADRTSNQTDIGLLKYDASGAFQWGFRYAGSGNDYDAGKGLVIDSNGDVVLTGLAERVTNDCVTMKVNSAGALQWVQAYDGGGTDDPTSITVQGTDVMVALTSDSSTGSDVITCKYNGSGALQWAKRYNNGGADIGTLITSAPDGSVYTAGYSQGIGTFFDIFTVKYNSSGVSQWTRRTRTAGLDGPFALAVDSSYNVYVGGLVTGDTSGGTTGQDAYTVKYNAAGTPVFSARYNGSGNNNDAVKALAVSNSKIYVAIESMNAGGTRSNIVTIQY